MSETNAEGDRLVDEVEHARYYATHHQHMGLSESHPLRGVEFDANFRPFLPPPPARVLDIGFGQGWTLRRLAGLGYEDLHGWDVARDCVAEARESGVPGRLENVDAIEALHSIEPNQFDAILAKDLLEHLSHERVLPFVSGVHRALAQGGVFLARLPNMANPLAGFLRYDDFTHRLGFTENSVRQVLALGGFAREEVRVVGDFLPSAALLRQGLVGVFLVEKAAGPLVRLLLRLALSSQRKGAAEVQTLRLIVCAMKSQRRSQLEVPA